MKRAEVISKTIAGEEKSYKFDVEFNYGSILSYPYCKGYYLLAYPMKQLGLNLIEDSEFEVKTLLFEIDKPDDTSLEFALRVADQYIDTSILQIEQKKIEKDRKISKNRDKIDKEIKGIGSYDYEFDFNVDEYLKDLGVEVDKDDKGGDNMSNKFNGKEYKTEDSNNKKDNRLYGIEKCKYYMPPSDVTFDDIAGMRETKEEIMQAVDLFKNPEKYKKMGMKKKLNNIMLSGASGCGKTLLAKAISNELGIPMFATSGDVADKYVGQSSRNIETLFNDAKKYSPSLIFVDEFESMAKQRTGQENNQEREGGVSTLLAQLDGMGTSDEVMVIVATNLPDSIDEAVRRRFPTKISVSNPDFETRRQILEINTKDTPLEEDCDLSKIARNLSGFNGGDISEIVSSAIMLAVKREKETVGQKELEDAMERVVCGLKSKTKKVNEEEKSIIAYHECGHSITTYLLKKEKIQRISIIPTTGSTLGYVYYANEDDNDRFLQTKEEMLNSIIVALAGRASEEIVFNKVTGGCSNDLEKATHIAETMVTKLGMTKETFGLMSINPNDIFMRERVVNEVNHILNDCYEKAKEILNENRTLLDEMAKELINKEEMNLEDFERVLVKVGNK